jgi:mRNA interferase RelE/StbE
VTEYLVTFAASAKKELRDLPAEVVERLILRIRSLSTNPRPVGSKKLQGYRDRWRIRLGDYRVVYSIDDTNGLVDITRVAHRREVYDR